MEIYCYIGEDKKRIGPVSSAELKDMARAGNVKPDTIVEVDGKKAPARKVKGLFFPPAAVPPEIPSAPIVPPPPLPEMKPASDPSDPLFESLKISSEKLEKAAGGVNAIGWIFAGAGIASGAFGVIGAVAADSESALFTGLGGLFGGLLSAQVPFFLARLGRFLIAWTKYNSAK